MDAKSAFDDPRKYATYVDYFKGKYGLQIFHPEFPLILVKDVGKQLNFLTKKVDGKVLRKDMTRSINTMVPELTNVHPIPASMFVQGKFLPSILHRVNRLLIANQLRLDVATHFERNVDSCQSIVDESELNVFGKETQEKLLCDLEVFFLKLIWVCRQQSV